ncbi:hypothetical protein D3C76_1749710 [compost metagenome]
MKLAVVVIFDDPGIVLPGLVEQLLSTGQRQRDRQRALVRRGDDNEPGIGVVAQQIPGVHA